jgi:hypothetical protein
MLELFILFKFKLVCVCFQMKENFFNIGLKINSNNGNN